MIRDEDGNIVAGVRYRIVYLGETMESYGPGDAARAIERAQQNPPAKVLAQAYTVSTDSNTTAGMREIEGPWVVVYPPSTSR